MPTFETEVVLALPASRLWKSMKDANTLFPKVAPEVMASIEVVGGADAAPAPGAVRIIKFGSVAPEGAYVKEQLVSLDHDTMTVVSAEMEGGHLAAGFTKWEATMHLVPEGDASVKVHFSFEYEGPGPVDVSVAQATQGTPMLFKALEAYLLANPDA
ncbi:hypothetical protein MPTK1_2g21850 [Marchantia polymorpha subsp. ruderalis]|nr:hypothetical protein MARPO_0040s0030 [Marchantia polymorpha]BBN03232.1 hypothetical protein Mp_2g21850 [Marchantia polymorpha subsp. ruderalis]|eukprot:PTQ40345.1 hypothetical protein MARPO_0040s0030 [Marchantia polymorpha]